MGQLAKAARSKSPRAAGAKAEEPEAPNALRDCIREAWNAQKTGDFDKFADAFESAVSVQLADQD